MADTVSGTLISRNYANFRGVDFSNRKDEVSLYRSPDALNMWKNYKSTNGRCVETRPDIELLKTFSDTIFGLFFYNGNKIVHSGTKLYDEDKVIYSSMAEHKSNFFIYEKIFIFLVIVGTVVVSMTSLYVSFTPVGNTTVLGYQGRYLIPVFLPTLALFTSPKFKAEWQEKTINYFITYGILFLNILGIFKILIDFYL